MIARWRLGRTLGCSLPLLSWCTLVFAASAALQEAKTTTQDLTAKNKSALIEVSSAVPDEDHIEVVEVVQGLELSRDRIILFLDRIEDGLYPREEGVKRAVAIAHAQAQKEKEFLQELRERVPPQAVPAVERALTVSAESWEGVLIALDRSNTEEKRGMPSRPRTTIDLIPTPFPIPSPGQ